MVHPIIRCSLCYFIYPEICQNSVSYCLGTLCVQSGDFSTLTLPILQFLGQKILCSRHCPYGVCRPQACTSNTKSSFLSLCNAYRSLLFLRWHSFSIVTSIYFPYSPTGYYFGLLWDRVHEQRSRWWCLLMLLLLVYNTTCVRRVRCSFFLNKTLNNHC